MNDPTKYVLLQPLTQDVDWRRYLFRLRCTDKQMLALATGVGMVPRMDRMDSHPSLGFPHSVRVSLGLGLIAVRNGWGKAKKGDNIPHEWKVVANSRKPLLELLAVLCAANMLSKPTEEEK